MQQIIDNILLSVITKLQNGTYFIQLFHLSNIFTCHYAVGLPRFWSILHRSLSLLNFAHHSYICICADRISIGLLVLLLRQHATNRSSNVVYGDRAAILLLILLNCSVIALLCLPTITLLINCTISLNFIPLLRFLLNTTLYFIYVSYMQLYIESF